MLFSEQLQDSPKECNHFHLRQLKHNYNFSTSDGLAHNLACSFLEDGLENIWIGTEGGINLLSPLKEATIPDEFALEQNYPNPFNPSTEIRFQLPEASQVVVKIFNTLGQEIRALTDNEYKPGFHTIRWDGKNNNGSPVSSGTYLYQLKAGVFSQIQKMSLIR